MKTKILKQHPFQVALYVISMIRSLAVPYFFSMLIDTVIPRDNFTNLIQ